MINDDFFNIARKMLATVSAGEGIEKEIPKWFWHKVCIFRVSDRKIYYPSSTEVQLAFEGLIKNKVVKFRDCGDNLGITLLVDNNKFPSTFSFSTRP